MGTCNSAEGLRLSSFGLTVSIRRFLTRLPHVIALPAIAAAAPLCLAKIGGWVVSRKWLNFALASEQPRLCIY